MPLPASTGPAPRLGELCSLRGFLVKIELKTGDRLVLLDDSGYLVAGPAVLTEHADESIRATIYVYEPCPRVWVAVLNDDNTVREVDDSDLGEVAYGYTVAIEAKPPRPPVPPNPKGPVL